MILADTSIIVASICIDDKHHHRALTVLDEVRVPLITTWPCITEAMHLLGSQVGSYAQERLRLSIEKGLYSLYSATQEDANRICVLMRKYADAPMDFADASLVATAEVLNITRILTLDRHFYAYRINDQTPFNVAP